jgi:hypothetical protein
MPLSPRAFAPALRAHQARELFQLQEEAFPR